MEQIPSSEIIISPASQEIHVILRNLVAHYPVHMSQPLPLY